MSDGYVVGRCRLREVWVAGTNGDASCVSKFVSTFVM